MTKNRLFTALSAFLLAAVLTVGGMGCLVTGFDLPVANTNGLVLLGVGISLFWAVACQFRVGTMLGWLLAGIAVIADWLRGGAGLYQFRQSVGLLIHTISKLLDNGYGWGVVQWDDLLPSASADMALALMMFGISCVVAWTVCKRQSAVLAVPISFLPLAVCLILIDTVPDTGYLWLLFSGIVLLLLTNPLRRRDEVQSNRLVALLLIPVLLFNMLLFWAVPQEGYEPLQLSYTRQLENWFQGLLWGGSGNTGISAVDGEIRLDNLDSRTNTYEIILWVRTRASGRLYLRGQSFDTYDGQSWTASPYSSGIDTGWAAPFKPEMDQALSSAISSRPNRGAVQIETAQALAFYLFPDPLGEGSQFEFEQGYLPNPNKKIIYDFWWGLPTTGRFLTREMRDQCLALPQQTQIGMESVLQQLGDSRPENTEQLALAVAELVKESAAYSLQPSRMPLGTEDFALWFLQEAEQGYCVHFATTAAVLLRALGVPARYVTGYVLDAQAWQRTPVPEAQAHAWVEYFDAEKGWTVLEATPGYEEQTPLPQPTEPTQTTQATTLPTETTQPTTQTTAPTQVTAPTMQTTQSTSIATTGGVTPPEQVQQDLTGFFCLLWVLLAAGILWGQYRLRLWLCRRYLGHGQPNQRALRFWHALLWRSRLLKQPLPHGLLELTEKAKFSQHILTEAELEAYQLAWIDMSDRLRKKPWAVQWLLRLLLAI